MAAKSFLLKITDWLQSTEMFERPRKKLPGKWILFEYFVDKGEELLHFQEDDLKKYQESFTIEFESDEQFLLESTISIKLVQNIKHGSWSVSRNFVSLIHPENFRDSIEFQFAFDRGNLKMLKKDAAGKIEFFGIFRKQKSDT
ncbi:DUF5004 domain-containing protein [Prolixibacteraceae bacterium Z1-6]|uniref:DUF5004 domain-containing protein n=1 Tax=Draconibacterium aestuarii TaxID=2998507 RepID=A0A9X3F815_9BACT|nr:DUF5004 domain-containing protein [Prolixibacteraceae bacterium Z1-6]